MLRRTSLKRRSPLRARPKPRAPMTFEEQVWKAPVAGFCQCGCGRHSTRLHRHHILLAQTVRREGGNVWALSNSLLLHPDCHAAHHSGARKIQMERVPDAAIEFAVGLIGEGRTMAYFTRRYAGVNHDS